jgi:ketosteroid isomerase-like protein
VTLARLKAALVGPKNVPEAAVLVFGMIQVVSSPTRRFSPTLEVAMRAALLLGLSAMILPACNKPPKADESESPLAMEDSARAHLQRIEQAMENGDSAAYMAAYPEGVVMLDNGQMARERDDMARGAGEMMRAVKLSQVDMSEEKIRVVGPRAAAVSIRFSMAGTATPDGKPFAQRGVWSGVLGVQDGKTVILQQHISHPADSVPEHAHEDTPSSR